MESLVDRVRAADVRLDPFPHIAVDVTPFQATLRDKVIAGPELAQRRVRALRA